jgi:leucyl aminopeptidase
MEIRYTATHGQAASLSHLKCDVLLLGIQGPLDKHPLFAVLDATCGGTLASQAAFEEFTAAPGQTLVRALPKLGAAWVVVFGVGAGDPISLRQGLKTAFGSARKLKAKLVTLGPLASKDDNLFTLGELVGEIAATTNHNPKTYKTQHSGYKAHPQFDLTIAAPREQHDELRLGIQNGKHVGDAINFACDLADEPANIVTPTEFRDRALQVATTSGGTISAKVLDRKALQELNAQGILMVSRGSSEEPFLIELTYQPKEVANSHELVLIGKTVTFDTGGNNIKTGEGMRHMKRDKTGGAYVLGAIKAIAALQLPLKVKAYFAATENMVGSNSFRPGDVFPTMSGRTVEVGNTDAEGRLTLVDAIEYAQRNSAQYIVDVATLTGAAKTVAGTAAPLAFGNHIEFSKMVERAAMMADEPIQFQQMLEEVRKYNDSPIADICNTGGAAGAGSMAAAWFIREWVRRDVKWVHLDIANVHNKNDRSTGHTIRTMISLAKVMSKQ